MNKKEWKKSTKYIAGSAGAVTLAIASCVAGTCSGQEVRQYDTTYLAGEDKASDTDAETIINTDDLADKLAENLNLSEKEVDKDETVYAFAAADGTVEQVLVNETLKNNHKEATLEDTTNLKNIVNLKGDETFTQQGNKLVWDADGAEISYQGTTEKALPVTVSATYYLDGNEIKPEELAGKSGKVKIRLDYTSEETVTKTINGKDEKISVPFVAVSGMILGDNFTNIQVTNGKYLEQGENKIVIGYALPGLDSGVKTAAEDLDTEIPEYVEVSADVVDFSLDMTVTLLVNGSQMNFSGGVDLTDLDALTESLQGAGNQLADGSGDLADGAGTLKDGMDTLAGKSGDLTNGIGVINQSAQSIAAGVNQLDAAVSTKMTDAEKQAVASQAGTAAAASVETQFAEGTDTYNQIYNQAVTGYADSLNGATEQIAQAYLNSDAYTAFYNAALSSKAMEYATNHAEALMQAYGLDYQTAFQQAYSAALQNGELQAAVASGVQEAFQTMAAQTTASLAEGGKAAIGKSVVDACKQSATQAASQAAGQAAVQGAESAKTTIASQIEAIQENGYSLVSGANALADGTSTLAGSVPALQDGISQLVNGATALADGAGTLSSSLVSLNNDAIKKMVNAYNGDVKDAVLRLQAAMEAATEYDSFGGILEDNSGMTKFIIKTAAISAE